MRAALTVVALVLGMNTFAAAAGASLGDDPANFNKLFNHAWLTADAEFMKAVCAEGFRLTVTDQKNVMLKPQFVALVANGKYKSRNIITDQVERHGDVVIATAHTEVRYEDPKRPGILQIQVRVYQLGADKQWRVVSMRAVSEAHLDH